MKRILGYGILTVLLLAAIGTAMYPQVVTSGIVSRLRTDADCDNEACVATGQVCITGAVLYACNVGAGNFDRVGQLPGGSDTQVQFNDSSVFGGDAGLVFNKTTDLLTVAGGVSASGGNVSVTAGQRVNVEGAAGDTYLHRETATASLDATVDGTLGWSVIGGMLQPPPCPADLNLAPPGFCYRAGDGKTVLVGALETFP